MIERSHETGTALEEAKQRALDDHDRRWQQARDRLAHRPEPAPSFDPMGGSVRNLARDYEEMRERWTAQRDRIAGAFDDRIAAGQAARDELIKAFANANEARDQEHSDSRNSLIERQTANFDRLVTKEIDGGDQTVTREFQSRTRDDATHER